MKSVTALPFAFEYQPEHTALLMIDMQRDFIEHGGFGESLGNDVTHLQSVVPVAQQLLQWARNQGMTVVHTKECHKPDLSDLPPAKKNRGNPKLRIGDLGSMGRLLIDGETGSDFIEALEPVVGEIVISKPGKGAFYATDLQSQLDQSGIRSLIVAGVTTEVCVQTSMREANDRGYDCLLVSDATGSYFPQFKQATLEMIVAQGAIVGWATDFSSLRSSS